MKRLFLPVLCLISFPLTMSATKGFLHTWGDSLVQIGCCIERTKNDGFIIAGSWEIKPYPDGRERVCLIKTNIIGDTLWCKLLAPNGLDFSGTSGRFVQQTSDGGYVIVGDGGTGNLALLRTDSLGDTLWTRLYGKNVLSPMCVRQAADGGFAIIASQDIYSPPGARCWLLRTDSNGDTLWTRFFTGDSIQCRGTSMLILDDGGYIITGYNRPKVWVHRTDENGDSLWTLNYRLGNPAVFDEGYSIESTSDGGYIVTGVADEGGFFTSGALFLLKTDSLGDSLWAKIYDPTTVWDAGTSVHQTPDGGYIIAGTQDYSIQHTGKIWLLKTDSEGDMLWERTFEGNPDARGDCLVLCSDGGYAITGYMSVNGSPDIVLIKTDSLGFVGVKEQSSPLPPPPPLWDVASAVGSEIVLKYKYLPQGFALTIYDTSGRKVDEICPQGSSGELRWGSGHAPGVYIIRERQGTKAKVVLLR